MRHPIIAMMSLVSALVFSQAPEFMQQYFQRLRGVVEELDRIVGHFDEDSHRSGYERSAALGLMARNPERLIRDQATRMEENVARLKRLHEQQNAFRKLGSLGRFGTFVMDFDGPLVQRTWDSYMPAVPMTMDGALFSVFGFFLPYFLLIAMANAFRGGRSSEADA